MQLSICCFWLIVLGCSSEQKEITNEVAKKEYKHFLSIEDVKARIEAKEPIRIIDISKLAQYEEKHLPNAIHVWRPDYEN